MILYSSPFAATDTAPVTVANKIGCLAKDIQGDNWQTVNFWNTSGISRGQAPGHAKFYERYSIKRSQWKDDDHDELGELREESQAQGKFLQSIEHIIEGLKANGGGLDKAVGKIEKSARDNTFNVSDVCILLCERC